MYCQNFTIIESSFDLAHNENFRRDSSDHQNESPKEPSKKSSKTITCSQDSPITSGPVTPSTVETPNNSRPRIRRATGIRFFSSPSNLFPCKLTNFTSYRFTHIVNRITLSELKICLKRASTFSKKDELDDELPE
ncbi:hypothetical protein GLOIN_2v1791851 [Rhizophagus irregularis DAOM 181602=DAOM 197198]|nr:hypothetical protein GLOIN_2v1791851 [Rhizophagus irregularis DAOM 181602=DAOM 197198]